MSAAGTSSIGPELAQNESQNLEDITLQNLGGVNVYDSETLQKGVVQTINKAIKEKELNEISNKINTFQQEIRVLKDEIDKIGKEKSSISKRNYSEVTLIKLKTLTTQNEKFHQKLRIFENKLRKAQFDLRLKTQKANEDDSKPNTDLKLTEEEDYLNLQFEYDTKAVSASKSLKERSNLIRLGLATPFSFNSSDPNTPHAVKLDDAFGNSLDATQKPSVNDSQNLLKSRTPKISKQKARVEDEQENDSLVKKRKSFFDADEYKPSSEEQSEDETELFEQRNYKRQRQRLVVDDANPKAFKKRLDLYQRELMKQEVDGDVHPEDKVFNGGLKVQGTIWKRLYKYQQTGVKWLWELHMQKTGGILGDEMGLGKTIQVVSFLAALSKSKIRDRDGSYSYDGLGPVLVVCPATVMQQWVREFHAWAPFLRVAILHSSGTHKGSQRDLISNIALSRGVLVTSYERVRLAIDDLLGRGWHYLVLDEGHKIRNPEAGITHAVKLFPTPHRLILSGSPIQNHLRELWSLFDFVFPGKLGTLPVFMEQFSVPIVQGGYSSASEVQVQTAYKCACMLRNTIAPYLLRRLKQDVQSHINLPEKTDQVLFCSLTPHQIEMYESYLNSHSVHSILSGKLKVFVGLIQLRKICNHPDLFSGGPKILSHEADPEYGDERRYGFWKRSGKLIVVESLLRIWKKQGRKVLLFTQSKMMLNILEDFVKSQSYTYLTMHGSSAIGSRQQLVNSFNEDPNIFVFILTTRVGGLGVNLIGADRVVIYDPDWNPSTDAQAQERAWRIGQDKQVTIYRLLTTGTIEEKIYHRQIFKHFVSNRILKDPRQRRFFKANDMHELFVLGAQNKELVGKKKTETAAIFAGTGSEVKIKHKSTRLRKDSAGKVTNVSCNEKNGQSTYSFNKKQEFIESETNSNLGLKSTVAQSLPQDVKTSSSSVQLDVNNIATSSSVVQSHLPVEASSSSDLIVAQKEENSSIISNSENKSTSNTPAQKSNKLKSSFLQALKKFQDSREQKTSSVRRRDKNRVDGESVPSLVKKSKYKHKKSSEAERMKSDDYVLSKLFNKGVHSALKHTTIMESSVSDYALVEAEANRVAKEAVRNIRLSRQKYKYPQVNKSKQKKRFGNQSRYHPVKKNDAKPDDDEQDANDPSKLFGNPGPMSSSSLLLQIRKRNHIETDQIEDSIADAEVDDIEDDPLLGDHDKLLQSLVEYLSSQDQHRATTQDIMKEFQDDVKTEQAPEFKAMLHKVCSKITEQNNQVIWVLNEEFR